MVVKNPPEPPPPPPGSSPVQSRYQLVENSEVLEKNPCLCVLRDLEMMAWNTVRSIFGSCNTLLFATLLFGRKTHLDLRNTTNNIIKSLRTSSQLVPKETLKPGKWTLFTVAKRSSRHGVRCTFVQWEWQCMGSVRTGQQILHNAVGICSGLYGTQTQTHTHEKKHTHYWTRHSSYNNVSCFSCVLFAVCRFLQHGCQEQPTTDHRQPSDRTRYSAHWSIWRFRPGWRVYQHLSNGMWGGRSCAWSSTLLSSINWGVFTVPSERLHISLLWLAPPWAHSTTG